MRIAALILVALFCCGCAKERAQVASDARAGIAAAAPHADPVGQAILAGVDARLPAVADVNSADWPAPAMKPEAIEAAPQQYISTAPPEPTRGWLKVLGIASAIGVPLLFIIGRIAPAIPGLGTAVGMIANTAWTVLAHRDQKSADAAKDTIATYAGALLPVVQSIPSVPPQAVDALKLLAT